MRQAIQAIQAGLLDAAVAHLSAAVREATAVGDVRTAALACARLGGVFQTLMGNKVAARPWFTRAVRLLADEPPCVEQGWVALAPLGCDVDDVGALMARADDALELARRFGAVDLEVKALADGGLARVQAGLIDEGMARLDEALALACGGDEHDPEVIGKSVCSFYTACYQAADFDRVASWTPVLRQREVIGPAPGSQAFLSGHCDSVRASLLCHLGRWGEAEEVLVRAQAAMERVMPGLGWHTTIALAELRILQGRLAEAEALLLGRDDQVHALVPMARLHLARGDAELACATARRGLRMLSADRIRAAALLAVVVESELARCDLAAAEEASRLLDAGTVGLGLPGLQAEAYRLRARISEARGEIDLACTTLHQALDLLSETRLERQRMGLHLELARLHEAAGDRPAAIVEARAAAALLARLDLVVPADDLTRLERLGTRATAPGAEVECRVATLHRADRSWWTVSCGPTTARLRNSKGLRYLADLVSHPGVDRHALDLVDLVEGVPDDATVPDRRRLGDAGELLDGVARDRYRRRIAQLRQEVEDALAVEDDDLAARTQTELDALVAELARAFGLGGRARRAGSAAERARLNVTRAVRAAIANLVVVVPEAGAVLDRRVRTGLYCSYRPHPDDGLLWNVDGGSFGPH
jgi:tetratricopeptide (TPR) repeat protein